MDVRPWGASLLFGLACDPALHPIVSLFFLSGFASVVSPLTIQAPGTAVSFRAPRSFAGTGREGPHP